MTGPCKTLHLTNAWHAASGGVRTSYLATADEANRAGRPLRLVVPGEADRVEAIGDHVRVYHVRAPRAPAIDRRYRVLYPHAFVPLSRARLASILLAEQPDVVEICDKYTLMWLAGVLRRGWLRGLRRPVLVGLSCERMDDNVATFISSRDLCRRLSRQYIRQFYLPMFDFHLAASDYVADELHDAVDPTTSQAARIVVSTPGVDTRTFSPACRSEAFRASIRQRAGAGPGAALLVYAGRLSREKNVALLVEMIERLAASGVDARLAVAGGGPLAPWLERVAVERLGGRLLLLGHLERRDDLARLLAGADAFVHPNEREPFGIGPLEAMAAGCPVVVPHTGGVRTYASTRNAWTAAPSPGAFADQVRRLLADPHGRETRRQAAFDTAAYFAWPRVIARLFATYDDFVREWRGRPASAIPSTAYPLSA